MEPSQFWGGLEGGGARGIGASEGGFFGKLQGLVGDAAVAGTGGVDGAAQVGRSRVELAGEIADDVA